MKISVTLDKVNKKSQYFSKFHLYQTEIKIQIKFFQPLISEFTWCKTSGHRIKPEFWNWSNELRCPRLRIATAQKIKFSIKDFFGKCG